MNKYLELLERIKNAPTIYCGCGSDIYTRYSFECKEIEKALKRNEILEKNIIKLIEENAYLEEIFKAFEIIKEKRVNVGDFKRCKSLEDYNDYCCYSEKEQLTQEEYDLLKEVLL